MRRALVADGVSVLPLVGGREEELVRGMILDRGKGGLLQFCVIYVLPRQSRASEQHNEDYFFFQQASRLGFKSHAVRSLLFHAQER